MLYAMNLDQSAQVVIIKLNFEHLTNFVMCLSIIDCDLFYLFVRKKILGAFDLLF